MIPLRHFLIHYFALLLILSFATLQFFLILRHKSPYLSDSYFYKHKFYQLKGGSFGEAYQKVKNQIALDETDVVALNIFTNPDSYKNSYSFFAKRPLYPLIAFFLDFVLKSEYLAFLIPVFLSYLGLILTTFYLTKRALSYFYASLATSLLVAFYPFLDYSTYFLTDTIGSLFWLSLVIVAFKYLSASSQKWLIIFSVLFALSLFNREQTILLVPVLVVLYLLFTKFKFARTFKKKTLEMLAVSSLFSLLYLLAGFLLNQKSLLDAITYTQNSYGLYQVNYSLGETLAYLANSSINSHHFIARDLSQHHWWFTFSFLAALGVANMFMQKSKANLCDLLMLASSLSSYLFIFIFPDFSYRYYYPLIIGIIYFAVKAIALHFEKIRTHYGQ